MIWIKRVIKLIYVASMTIFIIVGIEFFLEKTKNNDTYLDWINSKPKAFKNDDNYEVIKDSLNGSCKWPPLLHENGLSFHSKDFSCGGISYRDSKRLTLPEIRNWDKTIHIFGGSTVYGVGSDDLNTIPSLIQAKLIDNGQRVLNHGVSSYVASQQNSHFEALKNDIKEGDIIIYYDGGNDFWNGVILDNHQGTMVGFNNNNKFMLYNFLIRNWLSKNSNLYNFLSDIKHGRFGNNKTCNIDIDEASNRVKESAEYYAQRIDEARFLANKHGFEFIHFYQPTLFNNHLTSYEKSILSFNPCWNVAIPLKNKFDEIFLRISKNSIDLKNTLQETDTFFDYIHTSSLGNKIISNKMINYLENNSKKMDND